MRPQTHDLIVRLIEWLGDVTVVAVVVTKRENDIHAELELRHGDHSVTVDCRPSDAAALAVRLGTPIFVADHLVTPA